MDPDAPNGDFEHAPNIVLRGGPLDGRVLWINQFGVVVQRMVDGQLARYRPTGELDDEFPTMAVFVYMRPGDF